MRWWVLIMVLLAGCAGRGRPRPVAGQVLAQETRTRLKMIAGLCTEEVCPRSRPCCHSCSAGQWAEVDPPHRAARAATGQLPVCAVDGCGRCSYDLEASGRVEGDSFVATRWNRLPRSECAAQQCRGAGACDALLGVGLWIWTGERCAPFSDSGCALDGPDCERLPRSREDCERAHAACN